MRSRTYRHHRVDLDSDQIRAGQWVARATVVIMEHRKEKRIPIFGRRRATFDSRRQADAYALELAKIWVDGKMWVSNGHG